MAGYLKQDLDLTECPYIPRTLSSLMQSLVVSYILLRLVVSVTVGESDASV
jgi:hypothetical protein